MQHRLDTALSKLLLDEKRIDSAVLEEALQLQRIHGGALDTILLELLAIDEETLADALSRAHRTERLSLAVIRRPDAQAVELLPARMAIAMQICPVFVDERGLHVIVLAPLDQALVNELALLLKREIVAHVVCEVRLHEALAVAYRTTTDERTTALLSDLNATVPLKPLDQSAPPAVEDDVRPADWDLVEALAHLAACDSRDQIARVAVAYARQFLPFAAMVGIRQQQAIGWKRSGPSEGIAFHHRSLPLQDQNALHAVVTSMSPSLSKPANNPQNDALFGWLGRRRPRTLLIIPVSVSRRTIACLIGDGGVRARDFSQLSDLVAFGARLGPAFETLLRHKGRDDDEAVPPAVLVDAAPVVEAPRVDVVDPLASLPSLAGDEVPAPPLLEPPPALSATDNASTTSWFVPGDGQSPFARDYAPPKTLSTVPLSVPPREASDALDVPAPPPLDYAAESLSSMQATLDWQGALSEAVSRGIQGGTAQEPKSLFVDDNNWEPIQVEGSPVARDSSATVAPLLRPLLETAIADAVVEVRRDEERTQAAASSMPAVTPDASILAQVNAVIDAHHIDVTKASDVELVDALESAHAPLVEAAQRELISRGPQVIPALEKRFPGRLRVDPFEPGDRISTPKALGPLIEVLAEFKNEGLSVASAHLESRHAAHRFAAVMLFSCTVDERALDALRPRLHDAEPRIRALCTEALMPFLAHPKFEATLSHLRERVFSPHIDAKRRAVQLLGTFRDVASVPLLLTLLANKDRELAADARASLRTITLNDLGDKPRAWEKWWSKARKQTRIDWMIDALTHDARDLRAIALAELCAITNDDFGYRIDDDLRTRTICADKFRRFVHQAMNQARQQSNAPRAS